MTNKLTKFRIHYFLQGFSGYKEDIEARSPEQAVIELRRMNAGKQCIVKKVKVVNDD